MIDLFPQNNCPICCNPESLLLYDSVATINDESDLMVELRQCSACGHWWHSPMPTQAALTDLYASGSRFVVGQCWDEKIQESREDDAFHHMVLNSKSDMSRLNYLEVGCGGGHLIRLMSKKVALCYGIEPGRWASNMKCIVENIGQIPKNVVFDILVIQDVIEHTENPVDTLAEYTDRVRSGGTLFVSFPNKDSPSALKEKANWGMIRPFGHLQYFSRTSAALLMKKTGWAIRELKRGPNTFPLKELRTYNLFRTLKRIRNNDQWCIRARKR